MLSDFQIAKRNAFAQRVGLSAGSLSGPWSFVNRHSGKCLAIPNASKGNFVQAMQYTCDDVASHSREWYIDDVKGDNTWLHIVNADSGKCLTVQNASKADFGKVIQLTCNSIPPYNEEWALQDVKGDGWPHVFNAYSGKCLTIADASADDFGKAIQYTCDTTEPYNEDWTLVE